MTTQHDTPAAWLAALAPGDEVVVTCEWARIRTLSQVTRVTDDYVFVRWNADEAPHRSHEVPYDRQNGFLDGGTLVHIAPVTPVDHAMRHRAAVLDTIITTQWHNLRTETLERIAALVEVTNG